MLSIVILLLSETKLNENVLVSNIEISQNHQIAALSNFWSGNTSLHDYIISGIAAQLCPRMRLPAISLITAA